MKIYVYVNVFENKQCFFAISFILFHFNIHNRIAGARVRTPFTESNEMHVKDELKDPVLLEDIIEVLKIYKLLQRMKNK